MAASRQAQTERRMLIFVKGRTLVRRNGLGAAGVQACDGLDGLNAFALVDVDALGQVDAQHPILGVLANECDGRHRGCVLQSRGRGRGCVLE